jgi:hypothetical protein
MDVVLQTSERAFDAARRPMSGRSKGHSRQQVRHPTQPRTVIPILGNRLTNTRPAKRPEMRGSCSVLPCTKMIRPAA